MKYKYCEMPHAMKGTFGDISRSYGFSWKEFVMTIPSPMFLVTTFKSNGQPNACMQSWATFTSANKAEWVNAPIVQECFMNLECKYVWEKEIVSGDDHVMICLEVIGAHIEESYLADKTGENGLLYNIHYPLDPEHIGKTAHDYAGVLKKKIDVGEY